MSALEHLGRELARQIHVLSALREERKIALDNFKLQEQQLTKEINRLALDVRMGQAELFGAETAR
jgi:hypothetical protein